MKAVAVSLAWFGLQTPSYSHGMMSVNTSFSFASSIARTSPFALCPPGKLCKIKSQNLKTTKHCPPCLSVSLRHCLSPCLSLFVAPCLSPFVTLCLSVFVPLCLSLLSLCLTPLSLYLSLHVWVRYSHLRLVN